MRAPRIWRAEKIVAGEPRVLTTVKQTADPDPNDHNSVYDTVILDSNIDADWCAKNKNGGELDRVGKNIVDKYLKFRVPRYSAFTLSRSFFWNRVVHADPFYAGYKATAPIADEDINNDLKLRKDIESIRESAIPLLLIHLPYSIEVSAATEYSIGRSEDIAKNVTRITGLPVHGLVDKIGRIDRPERMQSTPTEMHPSTFGNELVRRSGIEGQPTRTIKA